MPLYNPFVQDYSEIILDTTATQVDNVYNNITDLFNAIANMAAGTRYIVFRNAGTHNVPSGAWNLDGVTFVGNGNNADNGGVTLVFGTGVTITSWAKNWNYNAMAGIRLKSTSSSPIWTMSGSYAFSMQQAFLQSTTAEFIKQETTGGVFVLAGSNGATYENGGYEIFNTTVAAFGTTLVVALQGVAPGIANNTLRSTNAQAYGQLKQTAMSTAAFATHTNLSIGFNFSAFSEDAAQIINTAAGNISSTTVQAAINELDTEKLALAGGTMTDGANVAVGSTTGTKIGTATTQKLGFFGATPIVQPTELTDELTTITSTAPGTPDYAIQNLTNVAPYGFVTQDEGNTVLSVIANLQTRVNELETKLNSLGFLADAD